jgi:hypothetical protein
MNLKFLRSETPPACVPAEKTERKRGRPKNTKPVFEDITDSVQSRPQQPKIAGNWIEFEFGQPVIFKQINSYFKSISVENIMIHFDIDSIRFECADHQRETFVEVKIDCTKVGHYYCKTPLSVTVIRNNLEVALGSIRAKDKHINFIVNEDERNSFLQVVIINGVEDKMESMYKIELITLLEPPIIMPDFEVPYTVNFILGGRLVKQICADKNSNMLTFLQEGVDESLQINSINRDKKVQTFKNMNNDEIQLQSTLVGDQSFRLTLSVDKFKHIGKSFLHHSIQFFLDNSQLRKAVIGIYGIITITIVGLDRIS